MANPAAQRTPTAAAATAGAAWPNDPGMNFGGWRRVNAAGQPLNPNGTVFTPTPGATWPALWTTAEVNAMVTAGPRYYFEAVWSPRIEFFKVSDVVNLQHPLGFNPLQGARFVMDHYVVGTGWVQAYPPLPATYIESDANGRVFISNNFAPLLELPRDQNVNFRLREILAPTGYQTPPATSHWIVTINHQLGVLPVFAENNVPAFGEINIPAGTLAGRRQFVSNVPYEFTFWKVDHQNTDLLLPGAQFQLLVYNGTGTPNLPAPGLVLPSMIGPGITQWSQVGTIQTSSATVPMNLRVIPGRYHHLLEIAPPQGYQMPMGQWRITVNTPAIPGGPRTLNITPMGGVSMPGITPMPAPATETYLIRNWRNIELPLTGNEGIRTVVIAGSAVMLAALFGTGFIVLRKRKGSAVRNS